MKLLSYFLLLPILIACKENPEKKSSAKIVSENVSITNDSLIWSDEFEGDSLNLDNWSFETGASGWGNKEWQNYTDGENVSVEDGKLKITAKKIGEGQKVGDYTSARVISKKSFTYGRMEFRAKIPDHKGKGIWPALWMLGDNIHEIGWPDCGEIDIMEYVSFAPNEVHQSLHSKANNHKINTQITTGPMSLETIEEEFHKYGIIWKENSLQFYIDDPANITLTFEKPENFTQENWPFDKPFFFLMNIAVGGMWGGMEGVDDTIFPATMEVDYVRVYN